MFSNIHTKKRPYMSQAGFSLIEVAVTSAIIGIISSIILFNYSDFNSITLLKNQAYEMALDVRQAQVFSISVRNEAGVSDFKEEFGLHFDKTNHPTRYFFFRDNGPDDLVSFDDGEELEIMSLDSRFSIQDLCVMETSGNCISVDSLDISFKRPHFDAQIVSGGTQYNYAQIIIGNSRNETMTKAVEVAMTGLIEVVDIVPNEPGGTGND